MQKLGLTQGLTWETHLHYIKAEYESMKKMDAVKLQEYYDSKHARRTAVLLKFDEELGRMHTAADARERLQKAKDDAQRR